MIRFIHLRSRFLVEAATWPHFTLIGQSLGSIVLCMEALARLTPQVFIDSMGYSFSFPFARLVGSRVACYVHYPTISTDMLQRVVEQRPTYNNDSRISASTTASRAKYVYYRLFALLYRIMGSFSQLTMVNSSWTKAHIDSLWNVDSTLVYPPCLDGTSLSDGSGLAQARDESLMISLGQFRPEKDHRLQLSSLACFKRRSNKKLKLVLIGSCRNLQDWDRVKVLREYAQSTLHLKEGDDFEFLVDASRDTLDTYLASAMLGIHTMWNEHFGISLVEMMAAGVIVIGHDSGGPKADIVTPQISGFLAQDEDSYAAAVEQVLEYSAEARQDMREHALNKCREFTDADFGNRFSQALSAHLL